ncbi:MAG: DUF4340 domain-containing protein [Nitrospina sp.]|nr:DUF4340 domain-containing protein [Nitrospina sp.]
MRFKGTALLAAALVGIISYYFLIDLPSEKRKNKEKDRAEKVILFDPENVKGISFTKGEVTITLKGLGIDEWQMTAPVNAKGDALAVSEFLSFLSNLNFTRVVEESSKDLSPFGLDTPGLRIILSMNNGETKGVRVGDDHPMGNKVYLALLKGSQVLAAGVTKNRLDRSAHDLRDKTILDFKTPLIKKIEFIRNGKTLNLIKDKESWQVLENRISAKGNETEITNLLNKIQAAQIKQFVEENSKQLTFYGLNNPKLTVKLTTLKSKEPLTLLVGNKNEHGFYAKTLLKKNVFTIGQSLFDSLNNREFVHFLNKSLVDFNDNDVIKMTLRMDNVTVDLIRNKKDLQEWTMQQPIEMKANTSTINSVLFDLKNTRIVEFVSTQAKNSEVFNFEQSEKEINLTYKSGETWALKLNKKTSNPDHYLAQRTDEEAFFTLQKSSVESIFRSLHDLKDRTLLEFNDDVVKEIHLDDSTQTFILKKSTNKWNLALPESKNSIQSFIGKDILWTLNSIEFESAIKVDPGNMMTGLIKPKISVKLLDKESKVITHISIGNPVAKSSEEHYLKIAKNPVVYTTNKRFLNEILINLKKVKENLT